MSSGRLAEYITSQFRNFVYYFIALVNSTLDCFLPPSLPSLWGLPPSPRWGVGVGGGIFNPLRYGEMNELTTKGGFTITERARYINMQFYNDGTDLLIFVLKRENVFNIRR